MASPEIELRPANVTDTALLARLNRQLIVDEGSRNPMSEQQLGSRFRNWLDSQWNCMLIQVGDEVTGYVVYATRLDEYDQNRSELVIRQLYVSKEHRRHGIGRAVVNRLIAKTPQGSRVVVEVLATNPDAGRFYSRLGFSPYSANLTRTRPS